jgi:hypothetical protein
MKTKRIMDSALARAAAPYRWSASNQSNRPKDFGLVVCASPDRSVTDRKISEVPLLPFQQTFVIPHHEVAVDLLHQIEGHTHGDKNARSAVKV